MEGQNIKEQVRERYAREAERVRENSGKASCCGGTSTCGDPITSNLYRDDEKASLPQDAVAASLGCGNPTALAELKQGETVLDLGSGGGIDGGLQGADAQTILAGNAELEKIAQAADGKFASAFIRARKPAVV